MPRQPHAPEGIERESQPVDPTNHQVQVDAVDPLHYRPAVRHGEVHGDESTMSISGFDDRTSQFTFDTEDERERIIDHGERKIRERKEREARAASPRTEKASKPAPATTAQGLLGGYIPHLILGAIAAVSIVALAAMAYAPGTETQFIQNTLGAIALAATAALAGIVKGPGN